MPRPREYLMQELRAAQKQLLTAKKRRNNENIQYLRARIAELQREMESAR
ncbi:MAG: hypothetical protein A4E48_00263 [Methanosaeta sp. PtaU1.Bin060]|nr:MAG: hypothetical protein A4E48_00263 [Methanosaeta sp. PtaU1.Bin060]